MSVNFHNVSVCLLTGSSEYSHWSPGLLMPVLPPNFQMEFSLPVSSAAAHRGMPVPM